MEDNSVALHLEHCITEVGKQNELNSSDESSAMESSSLPFVEKDRGIYV